VCAPVPKGEILICRGAEAMKVWNGRCFALKGLAKPRRELFVASSKDFSDTSFSCRQMFSHVGPRHVPYLALHSRVVRGSERNTPVVPYYSAVLALRTAEHRQTPYLCFSHILFWDALLRPWVLKLIMAVRGKLCAWASEKEDFTWRF